jgi:hypothetical protein
VDDKQLNYRKNMEAVLLNRVATDPAFRAEVADLAAAYQTADRETWPRE